MCVAQDCLRALVHRERQKERQRDRETLTERHRDTERHRETDVFNVACRRP